MKSENAHVVTMKVGGKKQKVLFRERDWKRRTQEAYKTTTRELAQLEAHGIAIKLPDNPTQDQIFDALRKIKIE